MRQALLKFCAPTFRANLGYSWIPVSRRLSSIKPFKAKDHSYARRYEDSFQLWILKLFENNELYSSIEFRKDETPSTVELKNFDLESLLNVLRIKKEGEILTPQILRKIDAEINTRINERSSLEHLLGCLHVFMTTVPIQSPALRSYQSAIIHFEKKLAKSTIPTHQLVQAMYYASHLKTRILAQKFISLALRKLDTNSLDKLSTTDLGIFCVSLFRSSVPIDRPMILQYLHKRLTQDIDTLINETAIFVSFIKCFRLSKYHDMDLANFIVLQGLEKLAMLDTVAKIHLAVFFSVCLIADVDFISAYLTLCVKELDGKIENSDSLPRLKEFDNLLWSCGSFNLAEVNSMIAHSKLPEYISNSLCLLRRDMDTLIALLLWLWVCEIRLEQDVVRYITAENVKTIQNSPNFKSRANLYQLLTCVQLESPNLLKPSIINSRDYRLQPKFEQYINKRPQLKILIKDLWNHGHSLGLENVQFAFAVPGLYIGGITAEYNGVPISIEVIDSSVCLTNSHHLNGRMKLKMRLLSKTERKVMMVPGSDLYDMEELEEQVKQLK